MKVMMNLKLKWNQDGDKNVYENLDFLLDNVKEALQHERIAQAKLK